MDPEILNATEPVVRPRPPRERHPPAHLADYEVQLPLNLHPEPPPADSSSQRPSRPSRHAPRSTSSGTVSSTSSRSHRSSKHRSPRQGLSDLQAAMLEERLKTLDLEKLQEQIEEDILVDKECERLDVQAREAQYRQEQAIKARELLAKQVESRRRLKSVQNELEVAKYVCVLLKQEPQAVNVAASQSSLAADPLSEVSNQEHRVAATTDLKSYAQVMPSHSTPCHVNVEPVSSVMPSPILPAVHITAPVAETPFSSITTAAEVIPPNLVKRSLVSLITAPHTLMSRPGYVAPLPSNPAVVARSHHYSDTSVTYSQTLPVSVLPTVPSTVPVTLGAPLQAQSYQTMNPSLHGQQYRTLFRHPMTLIIGQ